MTKAIAQTYTVAHEYRVQITTALLSTCAVLLVIYGINVYMVISHTIALQKTEAEVAQVSSTVAGLDAHYLQLSGNITPAILKAHGFDQGQATAYITHSSSLGVAMTNNEF